MTTPDLRPGWLATKRPTVENTLHVALDTLKEVQSLVELDASLAADVANTVEQIEQLLAAEDFTALTGAPRRNGGGPA